MDAILNGTYRCCCSPGCMAQACPGSDYCENHINEEYQQASSGFRRTDVTRMAKEGLKILKGVLH